MKQKKQCDHALHATDETGQWLAGSYEIKKRKDHHVVECGTCGKFYGRWPSDMTLPSIRKHAANLETTPEKATSSSSLLPADQCEAMPNTNDGASFSRAIDFRRLRETVSMSVALELLHYRPTTRRGPQLRGPCPIHGSKSKRSRSFSVNTERGVFQCFGCGEKGNQIDLWMKLTKLPVREAALDLCDKLGIDPPML